MTLRTLLTSLAAFGLMLAAIPGSLLAADWDYVVTEIPPLASDAAQGGFSRAYGINSKGQIVGRSYTVDATSGRNLYHAFIRENGQTRALPTLTTSGESGGWGINDSGLISGWAVNADGYRRAVRWDSVKNTITDLGTLTNAVTAGKGNESYGYGGINQKGEMVGHAEIPNDTGTFLPYHAFFYPLHGPIQDLGTFNTTAADWKFGYSIGYDLNQHGTVVGTAQDNNWNYLPFVYTPASGLKALPYHASVHDSKTGATYLSAEGEWYASTLNDSGMIAGHFTITAEDKAFPYYWINQSAAPVAIPLPSGFFYGEVYGVNAAGVIVGTMWANGDDERAFVFDLNRDSIARDLNAVTLLGPGITLQFAVDINSDGAIVGYGSFSGKERGFVLNSYAPDIAIHPAPQTLFGTVEVGATNSKTLTIINEGNAPLAITSISQTNPGSANSFALRDDFCSGALLQPAEYCTFALIFAPSVKGDYSTSFSIASTDPNEQTVAIAVTGTGSITPIADLGISFDGVLQEGTALSLNFGGVKTTKAATLTLSNSGTGNLNLASFTFATADSPFTLGSNTCAGASLMPGQTCSFTLSFTPTGVDDDSNTFSFTSNDPDEGMISIALSGQGLALGSNAPPIASALIFPAHGQRNVETTLTFRFRPCTDPDGDAVNYRLYLAETPDFAGATPQPVLNTTIYLAGLGFAAWLLLLPGAAFGLNLRRKVALCTALTLLSAATLLLPGCGGGGAGGAPASTGGTPPVADTPPATSEFLQFTNPAALKSNTTYYWKVVADDGQGGITESETRTFTTGQ